MVRGAWRRNRRACGRRCVDHGELAGRTFVVTELDGASLANGTALTLVSTNDAPTVSAGCNAIRADVEIEGDSLDVDGTLTSVASSGAISAAEVS